MNHEQVLIEIKTDVGVIKQEQQNLYNTVEKLARALEKITDSLKDDHYHLRHEYELLRDRVLVLEQHTQYKKESITTWVTPVIQHIVTASITSGFWLVVNFAHKI